MFQTKTRHRVTAILLSVTMLFTSIPAMAFAEIANQPVSEEPDAGMMEQTEEEKALGEQLLLEEDVSEEDVILDESTETSTVFELGDGKKMVIYHGQPVRYEDENGNLTDYDPVLIEAEKSESENGSDLAGYVYENKRGDVKHYIPEKLDTDTPVLMEKDDYSLTMSPYKEKEKHDKVKPKKELILTPYEMVKEKDVSAVYEGENVSYEYQSMNQGVKETLILHEMPENNRFSYLVTAKDMEAELAESGAVIFSDKKTEEMIAYIDAPFMNDATGEAYSEEIITELVEKSEGKYVLTYVLDEEYLQNEDRVYPVSVDPTATWKGDSNFTDAYVISGSGYSSTNFYSSDVRLMVAGKGTEGTYRTYVKLPGLKDTLDGHFVESANLTIYETGDCDKNQTIKVNRVTESWGPSSITWNNKPGYNSTAANSFTTSGTQYKAHQFSVTSMVRNFIDATNNPNYGFVLRNTTSSPGFAEFYGSRTTLTNYRPKLVVTYSDKPATPTAVTVSKPYLKEGENLNVSWSGITSAGLDRVEYRIAKYNDDGTVANSTYVPWTKLKSTTSASGSASIDVSSYANFGNYRIYLRGVDACDNTGTGAYAKFWIDRGRPSYTSVTIEPTGTTEDAPSTNLRPTIKWNITERNVESIKLYMDEESASGLLLTTTKNQGEYTVSVTSGHHRFRFLTTDKAGNYLYSTWRDYYVDADGPVIENFKITPDNGTPSMTRDATPTISWSVIEAKISKIYYSLDGGNYREAGTTATGSFTLPYLIEDGEHKVRLKVVDTAGNETVSDELRYYLDTTSPQFTECTINGSSGDVVSNSVNPLVRYVLKEENLQHVYYSVDNGGYIFARTSTAGSFYIRSGILTESKDYTIHIKAIDKTGHETLSRGFVYRLDLEEPTGTITTTLQGTGAEATTLSHTANISVTGSDVHSGVEMLQLAVYQLSEEVSIDGTVEEKETLVHLYEETSTDENYDLNTQGYSDGQYRLKLTVKDKAGNTREICKDVVFRNELPAPRISAKPSNTKTVQIDWTINHPEDYTKLQYRVDGNASWTNGPALNGTSASGRLSAQLPDAEGTYKVYVRGVGQNDSPGKESTVNCTVDKTAPTVTLQKYEKGYLTGTVDDGLDVSWTVSIKEKQQGDNTYTQIGTGYHQISSGQICFVDMSTYEEGKTYTLRLVATDEAGNTNTSTLDVYKTPGVIVPTSQDAGFRIERPAYQTYKENLIIFPSEISNIKLRDDSLLGSVKWYVDNELVSSNRTYEDNFLTGTDKRYQEDEQYHILAVRENIGGGKSYSSNWIKDGLKQEIPLYDLQESHVNITESIDLEGEKVLSLTLFAEDNFTAIDSARFYLKSEDRSFVEIFPNDKTDIADLFPGMAYAEDLTLKVTYPRNAELGDITFHFDILDRNYEENFEISNLENYRPEEISVVDKINYKTTVKWENEITENTTEDIYYEVYRSTDSSFSPEATSVVATGVRAGYAAEININYAEGFWYKVCAVEVKNGKKKYSSASPVQFSRVVDSDEYTKRMGVKEYWEYAEIDIPNGTLNVEKSMGNLVYEQVDASLPNEQMEVDLTRTYNSQSSAKSAFGVGWTHDYDIELLNICSPDEVNDNNIVMKDGSGTIYHFIKKNGVYNSSLGKFISLEKVPEGESVKIPSKNSEIALGSAYIAKTKDNLEYHFNSGGQLICLREPNENYVLLEYEAEKGVLQRAVTNRNTAIEFIYNDGSDGNSDSLTVSEIRLPDGSSVSYEYEGNASLDNVRLVKVTEKGIPDEEGNVAEIVYTYGYDSNNIPNVNQISDGKGNKYQITYNNRDQVDTVKYPDGEYIQLAYGTQTGAALSADTEDVITMENLGFETETKTRRFSNDKQVSEETDRFNGFGNCIYSKDTDNNVTEYVYNGHLLEETIENVSYHYIDNAGYVQESSEEKTEETLYTDEENEKQQIEADGGVTTFDYNEEAPDTWDDYPTSEVETAIIDGETETVFDLDYEYDDAGNEILEKDAVSNTTTITEYYNQDSETGIKGEVKSEKEYLGDTSNENNLQSVTNYTYTYDQNGNKTETTTQVCGSDTIVTTVTYDVMGREVSNTDSRGKRTDFLYDALGRLVKTTYTDGDIVTYTQTGYDNNGNVTYTRAENGVETSYAYDSMNREISRTVTKGSFSKTWTTAYGYENVTIYTGKGSETKTISNAFIVTEKDPEGHETAKTWQNHKGQVVRKLENGVYVDLTYDDQGNVFTQYEIGKEQTDSKGLLTMYIYDDAGNLTTTALNPVYTANGFYTKGADTIVQKSEFDASGNETASIDGEGYRTKYSYDVEGNVTEVVLPDGSVTSAEYDVLNADGTTTDIITDALDRVSKTTSDKGDLVTRVEDLGDGSSTPISLTYEYDAKENVTKETDAEGNYVEYLYDGKDRKTEAWYYNKSGNPTYVTKYAYESDVSDNLKVMADYTVSGTKSNHTEMLLRYTWYDYDELDRMTAMAELDGPATPTDSQIANAKITYSYDFDDNVTEITYPDHGNGIRKVKFEYNEFKWPTKVLVDTKSKTNLTVREYSYNNDGKLKSVKDYRGILSGSDGYILKEYGYDSFKRTNSITVKDSSNLNSVKESYGYTYDKNNNILTERIINSYPGQTAEKTDELRSHTYDCNGRLVKTVVSYPNSSSKSAVTYTYSYDAVGNRTAETESGGETTKSTQYVYNGLNQLVNSTETTGGTVTSAKTYLYDKTGNQIQETDSKTSEIRELSYDTAGNMTRLVKKKDGAIELTQENQYNGNGKRIRKTEADDVTRYFYQSDSVLYTADETDNLTSWNLLGSSGNAIGTTRGTGTAEKYYLYTKDIRESTSNIVDDSGAGVVSYQYNDFGETETFGNKNFFNEICYTGGIHDASTGIYYLNARYYDPASGVFLSQDSYRGELNDPASLNLYGYCQGNPITYTDPSGHIPILAAAVWVYRGYKAAKFVRTGVKLAKTTYKVAKSAKRVYKTVSTSKKTYNIIRSTKKVVRAVVKPKPAKKIRKITNKGYKPSRVKKASVKKAKKKKQLRENYKQGKEAEKALAKEAGDKNVKAKVFRINGEKRVIDHFSGGIAYESKTGYISASNFVKKQVAKDAALLKKNEVDKVVWVFRKSAKTGKKGPSKPLAELLHKNNIDIKIID